MKLAGWLRRLGNKNLHLWDTVPKNYIELKGVEANWSIGNAYRVKLNKMVNAMMRDIMPQIIAEYKRNREEIREIVTDSAADELYRLISVIFNRWRVTFDFESEPMADLFTESVNAHVERKLIASVKPLEDMSTDVFNTFKIKISENTKAIALSKDAAMRENVNLIRNIPVKAQEQIHQAVMASISRGRDTTYLEQELSKIQGLTKNRVKLITIDQNNKATSVINMARQSNLGIKKNIWRHSKAGKEPRLSHVAADGKVFSIKEGCLIDGEKIYPGQKIRCRCYSTAILDLD